jgi:hypothetical protein
VHQDQAIKLAALTARLQANPVGPCDRNALLVQRCLSAQLPSTLPDIQKLPLTNYTERDLVQWFQKGGFADIHLELHIDVRKSPAMPWDTYIDTAPHPGAPTLREIFQANFSDAERSVFEQAIRPDVESGQRIERSTNAYLTAVKPR